MSARICWSVTGPTLVPVLSTHKADISGGPPYAFAVPCAAVDALVLGERHQTTFVNLLRIAFRHGGFLGYDINTDEPNAEVPEALTVLGSSLESI